MRLARDRPADDVADLQQRSAAQRSAAQRSAAQRPTAPARRRGNPTRRGIPSQARNDGAGIVSARHPPTAAGWRGECALSAAAAMHIGRCGPWRAFGVRDRRTPITRAPRSFASLRSADVAGGPQMWARGEPSPSADVGRARLSAARVSAVSPLCEITITTSFAPRTSSRYLCIYIYIAA